MLGTNVPARPEDIDASWLQAALAESHTYTGLEFRGVDASILGAEYGLAGQVARLTLEIQGSAYRPSLVAKFSDAESGRNEIRFYGAIAPRMPVRLPAFYGGAIAENDDRAILLLEDLSYARQGDAVLGATREEADRVMRAMARFHLELEGSTSLSGLAVWDGRAARLVEQVRERQALFLERHEDGLDPRVPVLVEALPDQLPEIVARLASEPRTLIHSDLHLDNVLFLPSGEPVLIDWPHARQGPAIVDVARFLVEGITAPTRRAHEAQLLHSYGRVSGALDAALLWHLALAVSWAGAEDPGFAKPRVRELVSSLVRNTTAAALDHRP